MTQSDRRKFLKSTTMISASLAVGAIALSGCGGTRGNSKVAQKQFAKNEILYNGNTGYWREYYSNAK